MHLQDGGNRLILSTPMSSSLPTRRLLAGLALTLTVVAGFSWYALRRIDDLRRMQTGVVERNRRDSLQLLRIQSDLNSLALAIRDMLDNDSGYPLTAWSSEFRRIRLDLDDALQRERRLLPESRPAGQRQFLDAAVATLWAGVDEVLQMSARHDERGARTAIQKHLLSRHAAAAAAVARLLVQNNELEEHTGAGIQQIYRRVSRNIYWFFLGSFFTILSTGIYLINANRRIFERIAGLSRQRSVFAQKLIEMQEELLRSVSRELHDEFGQILTAVGAMLGRAAKMPGAADGCFQEALREVREITQATLEKVRSLSQALHPALLDDYGLLQAMERFVEIFERQTGIPVHYEEHADGCRVGDQAAVHVYRILQEALNNVARHSGSPEAWVRFRARGDCLRLEVEDRGRGVARGEPDAHGGSLGIVAMRERAALLKGRLDFTRPPEGGTVVSLEIPVAGGAAL